MTKDKLLQEIKDLSYHFEDKPWTGNVKLLKADFDINSISTPEHYWKIIEEMEEILRETRILFLYSIFNKVCIDEGKFYTFENPYQANMRYDAVMKKDGTFYIRDEDGHLREIFTTDKFAHHIHRLYRGLF